ncbi:hypothetical protein PAEH1_13085 [Paenalcaligenes hominis]|uniref:DUF1468 domain-containing protein n=1 Tax=Paenalcaligenes hominis TaxID=643674 RepID=A0A1U9K2F6_9BURK|nr:tripartite tricarboxylate transporter TctB family protein [Paenalcaligenes hominis]AQS52230.1 hypothetical protein PAEH1_13085 [Paenalcaligenes hominis]
MDKRKAELAASILIIFISAFIILNDNLVEGGVETDLGSMFLPRSLACLMILLALSMGCKSLKEIVKSKVVDVDEVIDINGFTGVFYYIGILFFYWLTMPYLGFMVSTFLVMISVAFLLGAKNWVRVMGMSIFLSAIIQYGAKEFLYVYLPTWNLF